ncbi:hypothetical protein KAI68_08310 [bacterium]|nr:hypothetical protein [bacterium]
MDEKEVNNMWRKMKEKKGQTVIEFLLLSPLLIYSLFLLLVIWDVCNNIIIANHAAYYFCRTFVVERSKGTVATPAIAINAAVAVMPSDWDRKHTFQEGPEDVSVRIGYKYPFPAILDFFSSDGSSWQIRGYCLMRKL